MTFFYLILIAIILLLFLSFVFGAIAFFKDINRFKTELEFSGNRKQLIKYLMENDIFLKKVGEDDVSKSR